MKKFSLLPLIGMLVACNPLSVASATEHAPDSRPATISVSASGTSTAVPDTAIVNLAVRSEEETARKALNANNAAMSAVLNALRDDGIEDRDLQTSNFSIQPRYVYPKSTRENPQPPRLVGYSVNNSLTVRIRDLDKLGTILDRSVTLGVNSGGSISFTNDKPEEIIEEARKNAVAAALAKARTLSQAAGVQLGKIIEISENSRQQPRPRPMARMQADAVAEASVPVAAGENTYTVSVQMRWELTQ